MYANIHRFSFWLTWSTLSLIDAAWCLLMLFDAEWSWFMLFDYDWCWSTWLMLIDADSDHAADAVTPAVAPGVTHFGAYHRPSSGNFSDYYDIKRFYVFAFAMCSHIDSSDVCRYMHGVNLHICTRYVLKCPQTPPTHCPAGVRDVFLTGDPHTTACYPLFPILMWSSRHSWSVLPILTLDHCPC